MCVSVSVWPEDGVGRDSSHTGGTEPSTVRFINDLVKLFGFQEYVGVIATIHAPFENLGLKTQKQHDIKFLDSESFTPSVKGKVVSVQTLGC